MLSPLPDDLPDQIDPTWVRLFRAALLECSTTPGATLAANLPSNTVIELLTRAEKLFKAEPTVLEVPELSPNTRVIVVGDTHGQYHDVCHMMGLAGDPSAPSAMYVWNGDVVDRGAWGLETLLLVVAWKLALPSQMLLLRGNHETATCSSIYGFLGEVWSKYPPAKAAAIYKRCKRVFAALPIACTIASATLVVHGGLWRAAAPGKGRRKKRQRGAATGLQLGDLAALRAASKGGPDPDGQGGKTLATDVLWSDPVPVRAELPPVHLPSLQTPHHRSARPRSQEAGLTLNTARGIGLCFGPDATQRFLETHGLSLVLRSHEGPDARACRPEMPQMDTGFTVDHVCKSGKLATVFSAPDYPQFQDTATDRTNNTASVVVLTGPTWAVPEVLEYAAVERPAATAFYDYAAMPGSDEEFDVRGDSLASSADEAAPPPARLI